MSQKIIFQIFIGSFWSSDLAEFLAFLLVLSAIMRAHNSDKNVKNMFMTQTSKDNKTHYVLLPENYFVVDDMFFIK